MSKKILVVDDSALMRRILCDIINADVRFQVADTAVNGLEALKLLLGMPSPVAGTLRRFDALTHQWQTLTLAPDPDCPVCGSTHPALEN